MKYLNFERISFVLHEVFRIRLISFLLAWSIFASSHIICLTWCFSNLASFILVHMKYFSFDPFHSSYTSYFVRPFHLTLHEVFPYRAISLVLDEVVKRRSISFYLTRSTFIWSHSICLTWRICEALHFILAYMNYIHFVAFPFVLHEVLPIRAILF